MDSRGDLRYNWKGNPIDLSEQQSKRRKFDIPRRQNHASTLFTSSNKPNDTSRNRGQGNQKGNSPKGNSSRGGQTSKNTQSDQDTKKDKSFLASLACKVCNKRGHNSLFYCQKFPEFIPRGSNVKSIPSEVCTTCLSVAVPNCNHKSLRGYETLLCKKYNINFLLCNQCSHYTFTQDWVKQNFNPQDGKRILTKIRESIPNYTATINSLQVLPNHPKKPNEPQTLHSHGMADIEEISQENYTAFIQTILVNNIRIGKACCPYKIVRVKVGATYFPVALRS